MNELAKQVFDYFTRKIARTGQPLDTEEATLFRMAQSNLNRYPVACLSPDDLEGLGFDTTGLEPAQLQRLAEKMGDVYIENDYWTSLTQLAEHYCIPRRTLEDRIREAYHNLPEGTAKATAIVGILYNNGDKSELHIHVGQNVADKPDKDNMTMAVADIDELCRLTKPNRYGFVINEFNRFTSKNTEEWEQHPL